LIDDPQRRREMGDYGRKRVERELEWGHEVPKLLSAYERLWSGGRSQREAGQPMRLPSVRL
ncbi:MAG: hypothetical protein ABI619_08795, partial [Betaproteobacteria bacterium]